MIFVTRMATFTACGPKVQGTLKGKWRTSGMWWYDDSKWKMRKRTLQIKETEKKRVWVTYIRD
jgi:hypothetical protein